MLFVTRDTVVHTFHGANSAIHNLLRIVQEGGLEVTVLVTSAGSRSARLFFAEAVPLPDGVRLLVPGYLRFGRWLVLPFRAHAWARAVLRASKRSPRVVRLMLAVCRALRLDVFERAWDLTEPTAREAELVRRTVAEMRPDAVIANYAFWGPLLRELRARPHAPRTVILMHDLLAEHVRGFLDRGLSLDCNPITPEMEADWLSGAETLLAIQAEEAAGVRARVKARVLQQPIQMRTEPASAEPEPLRCLFVGSNSPPNVQGLEWMMREVWPHVRAEEPDAMLAAVGSVCEKVDAPPAGVSLLGHVPSLAEEHRRAAVCVVPLLVGSGLKIKLLDALSFGKATVSTSVGVQGVEEWVADAVAVANEPESFAAEIVRLLRGPELRRMREAAATEVMRLHFSKESEAERDLLEALRGRGEADEVEGAAVAMAVRD